MVEIVALFVSSFSKVQLSVIRIHFKFLQDETSLTSALSGVKKQQIFAVKWTLLVCNLETVNYHQPGIQ